MFNQIKLPDSMSNVRLLSLALSLCFAVIPPPSTPQAAGLQDDARSLLLQSLSAMHQVHSFRAAALEVIRPSVALHTALRFRGDCLLKTSPARGAALPLKAHLYASGTRQTVGVKTPSAVHAEYIVLSGARNLQSWERSTRTHGSWRLERNDSPIGFPRGLDASATACSGLLLQQQFQQNVLGAYTFTNREVVQLEGSDAWRIHGEMSSAAGTSTIDFYLEPHSLRWLRIDGHSYDAQSSVTTSVRNSHFGEHLNIKPPK